MTGPTNFYNLIPSRPGSRLSHAASSNYKISNHYLNSNPNQSSSQIYGFNDINYLEHHVTYPIPPCDMVIANEHNFTGRHQYFEKILIAFESSNMVCLVGDTCTGKTSLLNFLHKSNLNYLHPTPNNVIENLNTLRNKIIATQFCQVDYDQTCRLPDIIYSLATQVGNFLKHNRKISGQQNTILKFNTCKSFKLCLQDAVKIFKNYIINPIKKICQDNAKIFDYFVLQIDDISASNYHRSSSTKSLSLLDLLTSCQTYLPDCCKILLTVRSENKSLLNCFNSNYLTTIELSPSNDEYEYCFNRLSIITKNRRIFPSGFSNRKDSGNQPSHAGNLNTSKPENLNSSANSNHRNIEELSRFLYKISKGDFLYLTLTLDLIESGIIRLKANNYSTIPQNRWQAINHLFKSKTQVTTMFSPLMHDILAVVLASLRPLSEEQLYRTLACLELIPNSQLLSNASVNATPTNNSNQNLNQVTPLEMIKSCPKIIPTIGRGFENWTNF